VSARNFDIAIIGGGIIGLAVARALAGEKARVVVIDAGNETPPATDAAAGMLAPSFEAGAGEPDALYGLSVRSLAAWPDFAAALEDETGMEVDFRNDGILGVAFDERQAAALKESCDVLRARGAAVSFLDGTAARSLEPLLSDKIVAALYAQDDAQVDPRKVLTALRATVRKNVGPVLAARAVNAGLANGRHVLTLSTGEHLEAETLVLASGAASAQLVGGLPPPPVTPVKGEALAVQMGGREPRRVIRGPGAYLCPKADARMVIGATEAAGRDDYEVDGHAIRELKARADKVIPAAEPWPEVERWAGLRPATPDGAPILGRDRRGPEGVFLALGHHRNGILLAPSTGELLALEVTGQPPLTVLQPFRPERFKNAPAARQHG